MASQQTEHTTEKMKEIEERAVLFENQFNNQLGECQRIQEQRRKMNDELESQKSLCKNMRDEYVFRLG